MKCRKVFILILVLFLMGCEEDNSNIPEPIKDDISDQDEVEVDNSNEEIDEREEVTRESRLPSDIIKQSPDTDLHPPILHSDEYETPILLEIISTSGAEDSPFILPSGDKLYFFFTPDVRVPANEQLLDGVTGIWESNKVDGIWQEPTRVWLQEVGKLALDGAAFVRDDEMWFASAREGYTGVNMFTSTYDGENWVDWTRVSDQFVNEYRVGEMHIYSNELYYHSDLEGGKGNFDIWMIRRIDDEWTTPTNIEVVNTEEMDGYPFISSNGEEMWFCRTYLGTPAVYRSVRVEGVWQEPELIVSQFAGEPTLDDEGNLYFVHHYFIDGVMIEADIYVAYKK